MNDAYDVYYITATIICGIPLSMVLDECIYLKRTLLVIFDLACSGKPFSKNVLAYIFLKSMTTARIWAADVLHITATIIRSRSLRVCSADHLPPSLKPVLNDVP